jgi:hypothetical protein
MEHSTASKDPLVGEAKAEMENAIVNGKRDRPQGEPRARRRTQHGGEHQDGNDLEEDLVSKQSLDYGFYTKLMDFTLA